jgi:hypothetical protein
MRAQRDSDWLTGADADRDPEMIDVRGDAIDLGGKRDWVSGKMNEVAVVESRVAARWLLSASMWQALKEKP